MIPPDLDPPTNEVTRTVQAWVAALGFFLLGVLSATGVILLR